MKRNQFQVQSNKKHLTLTAEKLVVYKQTIIIEATDRSANTYYSIFYKNNFINGVKANKIRINSYIYRALRDGISFSGTHPLSLQLLSRQNTIHFIKFNQLIKNVEKSYSMTEVALIFLFFDSFTKQGSSNKLFQKTFYHFRRNGKNLKAYRALKSYKNYNPKSRFAHDMMHNIEFQRYEQMYSDLESLYEKDPNYVELVCFDDRSNPTSSNVLFQLYKDQNRWIDELAVRIERLQHQFSIDNEAAIGELIKDLSIDDQILIRKELVRNNNKAVLQSKLLDTLLESNHSNEIVQFTMNTNYKPTAEQLLVISDHFKKADPSVLASHFDKSSKRLMKLAIKDGSTLEKMSIPFVSSFLKSHDLNEIIEWFEPFHSKEIHLPIEQKIAKMQQFADDPDKQFALGELYLDFHQLEKSIDCFKWEMELNPNNPKPIQYLIKIYQEIGKPEEAKAYQQLL
ncbi:tetratricopeptide repeat protein [Oceanobacillus bengalensis]|uniref:Uncharacterized protein n=1 Tax=Oceanobacillus bengalensis TaxID=1435466 RepID=A0A494Z293_9BACI|nr:hypothetical protein [Oceanobacillus bengalensis]RKQ16607.1 hypothetical protein D8M05_06940 [Oceanobacillus bengalensis]